MEVSGTYFFAGMSHRASLAVLQKILSASSFIIQIPVPEGAFNAHADRGPLMALVTVSDERSSSR
jgi:hypothetical protein